MNNNDLGRVGDADRAFVGCADGAASASPPEASIPSRRTVLLPVIHYADDNQVMRNAERAFEAGCEGVMLIEMRGRNNGLLFAGAALKRRWPSRHVGINHLSTEVTCAIHNSFGAGVDSTWTDEQLTHSSGDDDLEAVRIKRLLSDARAHTLFCAVAFKYQRHEPDPCLAAYKATRLGFIPTTSGPGTGEAANPDEIERLRNTIGPGAPLAIASGVTPDNAHLFFPHLTHALVATGVSSSFHEFDPARLRALVAVRDSDASSAEDAATRLSGEAVAARAVGIAQPPTKEPTP